jgi:hypothetical protein
MAKRIIIRTLLCLSILAIATVTLLAAGSGDGVVISFGGKPSWAMATTPSTVFQPLDPNPEKLFTIFSNLGTGRKVYTDNVGLDVAGPDSGVTEEWIAMPFTPTANAEVTRISVAVQHISGSPNSFVLSLNQDSGGLPGKVIHRWLVKDLPRFGTCCKLDIVRIAGGLKVKKGTQYWVAAETNSSERKTRDEWDYAYAGIEGIYAINNNNGQGWYQYTAFTSAFGVFGKKTN